MAVASGPVAALSASLNSVAVKAQAPPVWHLVLCGASNSTECITAAAAGPFQVSASSQEVTEDMQQRIGADRQMVLIFTLT